MALTQRLRIHQQKMENDPFAFNFTIPRNQIDLESLMTLVKVEAKLDAIISMLPELSDSANVRDNLDHEVQMNIRKRLSELMAKYPH